MEYYKLIDAITVPTNVQVTTKNDRGGYISKFVRLEPGMAYEMPTDDPEFRRSVLAAKTDVKMDFKEMLDEMGAEYEVFKPNCHCRKPFLKVKCVEVITDE